MNNGFLKINKTFIISSGRTGTKFFGNNLEKLIKNSLSIHEPDKIRFDQKKELKQRINRQGYWDLFFLKALGLRGARNLSLQYLKNKYNEKTILNRFISSRSWVKGIDYYFESNAQLFGLLSILVNLNKTKIVILFRDPRDWVISWMSKGHWYDNKDLLTKIDVLGFKRVTPKNVGIDNPQWKYYTRFQKLCWVWNYMNKNFYDALHANAGNIRHYFFEDIFIRKHEATIRDFLQFSLGEYFQESYVRQLQDMLENKVNQNTSSEFPHWKQWDAQHAKDLHYFCGDLMQKLGYGNEPEWQQKIS